MRIRFAVLGAGFAMVLPPFNWPPYLVLFLMIPLIDDARNSRIGLRLVSGVFFGLGFFLVLLKWLIVVGSTLLGQKTVKPMLMQKTFLLTSLK